MNNFGAVDFWNLFMLFESGYQGHAADKRSYTLTQLGRGKCALEAHQMFLADWGFFATDERHLIAQGYDTDDSHRIHHAHRCGIENTWHEFKIMAAVAEESRHSVPFQVVYIGAAARLLNYLWRRRLANGIALFDSLNSDIGL